MLVSSELQGERLSSFWLYSGPGKPGLGGKPGRAKQLGLTNLGVLLESVLHSRGFSVSSCPVKDSLWFLGHKGPMSSLHSLDRDLVTYERGPGCPAPCWPHCSLRPAKCFILCRLGLLMEGHLAIRLIWPGLMSTNCLGLGSGLQKLTGTVEAA